MHYTRQLRRLLSTQRAPPWVWIRPSRESALRLSGTRSSPSSPPGAFWRLRSAENVRGGRGVRENPGNLWRLVDPSGTASSSGGGVPACSARIGRWKQRGVWRELRELRWRSERTRYSKNTVRRTHSTKDEAGQKHKPTDVFDFPDNSGISSIGRLGENEKDEEPYETFDPPLHSTAIYADEEEFSRHCGPSLPSTPQGKAAERSSDTSDVEASENESVKISAKKPRRKLKPISDESESTEESDVRRRVKPAENLSTQREAVSATASSEPSEKPAESVTLKKVGPLGAKPSVEKETLETESQLVGEQKTDSRICKEAINKFHSNLKEELIKMLKEVQMLKTLKRKNTKMISDIEKKRQRLIEVQDELLRLEPELKQLQIKYDELKERKASLRNAAYFLSNLKQLHQDYSDIQEEEPNVKE
ncbi:hypothetical protein EI555_021471, partial [Monodon monoceros]